MLKMYILLPFLLLFGAISGKGQYLNIYSTDTTLYPIVKNKIAVIDNNLKNVSGLKKEDFKVTENGEEREVVSYICDGEMLYRPAAYILTIDGSGSMLEHRDITFAAANKLIDNLDLLKSECAITTFNKENFLLHDFSSNRASLKASLNKLGGQGSTDFNAALLTSPYGSLALAEKAKKTPSIIFMTDGEGTGDMGAIIAKAQKLQAKIYPIIIKHEVFPFIEALATMTGGRVFRVDTPQDAEKVMISIISESLPIEICKLTWKSAGCETIRKVDVSVPSLNIQTTFYYSKTLPESVLEINPDSLKFGLVAKSGASLTASIKAANNDIYIRKILIDNPLFQVVDYGGAPPPFTLRRDSQRIITIKYTPQDSSLNKGNLIVFSDACITDRGYLEAGSLQYSGQKKLTVIAPNGGEKILAGSNAVINWAGVSPGQPVDLYYSYDKGANWNIIAEGATGYSYNWRSVPKTISDNCLAKAAIKGSKFNPEWAFTVDGITSEPKDMDIDDKGNVYTLFKYFKTGNFSCGILTENGTFTVAAKYDAVGSCTSLYQLNYLNEHTVHEIFATSNGVFFGGAGIYGHPNPVPMQGVLRDAFTYYSFYSGINTVEGGVYEIDMMQSGLMLNAGDFKGDIKLDDDVVSSTGTGFDIFIASRFIDRINRYAILAGSGEDRIIDIKNTYNDEVAVIGNYEGNIRISPQQLNQAGKNVFFAKLDGNLRAIFAKTIILGTNAQPTVLETDATGNFYIGGIFTSSLTIGSTTLTATGANDIFVAKYDNGGNFIWAKRFGGNNASSGFDKVNDIAVMPNNNIIIAGKATKYFNLGNVTLDVKGIEDLFIAELDGSGNSVRAERFGGQSIDFKGEIERIKVDKNGSVFALGRFSNELLIGDKNLAGQGINNFLCKFAQISMSGESDVSDSVWSIVYPDLIAIDVNMGTLITGNEKDSIVKAFITNKGKYPAKNITISLSGSNANEFSVETMAPFELKGGESKEIRFSFKPYFEGLKRANINIRSELQSLTKTISGNAVKPNVDLEAYNVDFGVIYAGNQVDTIAVVIKNKGAGSAYTSPRISGDSQFILPDTSSFTLKPNETRSMRIIFKGQRRGYAYGTLNFTTSQGMAASNLSAGVRVNPDVFVEQKPAPYVNVCSDTGIVDVYVRNTTLYDFDVQPVGFKGYDKSLFMFLNPQKINLQSGQEHIFKAVTTSPIPGRRDVAVELILNGELTDVEYVELKLDYTKEEMNFKIDKNSFAFYEADKNPKQQAKFRIFNTGSIPIKWTTPLTSGNFTLVDIQPNITPAYNGISEAILEMDASAGIQDSAVIELQDSCGNIERIILKAYTGEVLGKISLKAGEVYAKTGENIEIPISVTGSENLEALNISKIKARISLNKTVFIPQAGVSFILDNSSRIIETKIDYKQNPALIIKGFTTLGETDSTPITLELYDLPANLTATAEPGFLKLTDVCYEGGPRLIKDTSPISMQIIGSNPVKGDKAEIRLYLIEAGFTSLELYNSEGLKIKVLAEGEMKQGERFIEADIKEIASGAYFIILKTPTVVVSNQVIIKR